MFPHDRRIQTFHCLHDILLMHETHLQIELRVLGLPVGAKVFVAEALCNLEVAFHARDHQYLLQLLR